MRRVVHGARLPPSIAFRGPYPMHTAPRLLLPLALTLALAACQQAEPPASADAAAPAAEVAAATADPAQAPAPEAVQGVSGTYVIDPTHTTVDAQWRHFGFSNPAATLRQAEGRSVCH